MRACEQSNPRKARESGAGARERRGLEERAAGGAPPPRGPAARARAAHARGRSGRRLTRLGLVRALHAAAQALRRRVRSPVASADEQAALVRRAFRLTLPVPLLAHLKPSILVRFCQTLLYSTL